MYYYFIIYCLSLKYSISYWHCKINCVLIFPLKYLDESSQSRQMFQRGSPNCILTCLKRRKGGAWTPEEGLRSEIGLYCWNLTNRRGWLCDLEWHPSQNQHSWRPRGVGDHQEHDDIWCLVSWKVNKRQIVFKTSGRGKWVCQCDTTSDDCKCISRVVQTQVSVK